MSSESKDFQFELNETLYFNRGDEVLELIGISLNPEVTIHSYDTYVSIKGEIELRGEYLRDEGTREEEEEDHLSFDDLEAKRYVEFVEPKEDRTAEFSHRFPVDISVPSYRIGNMEDIRIEIVNFDYELPANSKLQLQAVAAIQGIKAEVDLWNHREQTENEVENLPKEELPTFTFEVTREETDFNASENEHVEREDVPDQAEEETVMEDREETEEILVESPIEEKEEISTAEEAPIENELTIRAMETEDEEDDEEGEETKTDQVKDVSYLTDIFRDEEEESYTRMKICIVQEDDTIETIAERFQISALQLIKSNKLDEDFDISEGQLLYIPKK